MGLRISTDLFQERMGELMAGLEFARAYLDDLLTTSTEKICDTHLEKHEQVLTRLQQTSWSKDQCCEQFLCTNEPRLSWL